MNKQLRWKVSGALLGVLALSGCGDLLDVSNPNNLVEDDVQKVEAAAAVVNGAEALVWEAIGQIWAPYHVATDDFYWIGSRDAWFSLDQGIVDDPFNEFADAAFPYLGEARWMADYAVETIDAHVADGVEGMQVLQPRANLYAGVIYMVIGEVQQDFAFSNRQEGQPAVGSANMGQVFDQAIAYFDAAVSGFAAASGATAEDLGIAALALRARAKQSRAIRALIQPSPPSDPANGLVADAGAAADAQAALDAIGDLDWAYQATYSASTVSNQFSFEVNNRQENNIDPAVAVEDTLYTGSGVKYDAVLQDPVDLIPDPALQRRVSEFRVEGSNYQPADLVTARFLRLILAEHALAPGGAGDFQAQINELRALDAELSAYPGGSGVSEMDMLMHARRVNTWGMGVRLPDMYRWGITADLWAPTSAAIVSPGTLLPITCIEIRANENLSGC